MKKALALEYKNPFITGRRYALTVAAAIFLFMAANVSGIKSYAGVTYMPDVTKEMNTPEFWEPCPQLEDEYVVLPVSLGHPKKLSDEPWEPALK